MPLCTGYRRPIRPDLRKISVAKAVDAVAKTFELVLPHAEKAGIVLALENHPGFGVSPDVVGRILQKIPSAVLGWNFDMENAYRVHGQTAFDFLKNETILRRLLVYLCGPCYRKWIEDPVR